MIRLEGASKSYSYGAGRTFPALHPIDLRLEMGQVAVIRGPSGSGKTTLLSLIGCMSRPTTGRIWINEEEISTLPEKHLCRLRRRRFGFMFQDFQLVRGLSLLENVLLPLYPMHNRENCRTSGGLDVLAEVGLRNRGGERVENLSGGEQQRASLARALISNPDILVADEPTAHLDTDLSRRFLEIVAGKRSLGMTIIMASHDPLVFAASVIDRVVQLRDGRLVEEGASR